ncbi:MAG: 30S ribosomal protein S21 [Burkholderiaceae bacterium]
MPKVAVRNNNIDAALRVFKRKVVTSGLLLDYRNHESYERPCLKRNKKKQAAKLRERRRQSETKRKQF